MKALPAQRIEWIPIERITVTNPRVRDRRVFRDIVENIARIGLKRPVTVTRRTESDGPSYDLVCGQGRLEAFQALGQQEVPALVVAADPEDCLIASLVENCARRQHNALDLLSDIGGMKERGYSNGEIARRTGLSFDYVQGVARLLEKGERRPLRSVETRQIPISVAVEIAEADDPGVQRALQDAYDRGLLRGKKLLAAKRLVEIRRRRGRGLDRDRRQDRERLSSTDLVRAFEEESARKRDMIRRAHAARDRILMIVESLRRLASDEQFVALLEDEQLVTMPEVLASRLDQQEPAP
jgi:ParB family chromosome partitioning protein